MMEEARKKRRLWVGGSDLAGILGLSKWSTRYQIWAEKTGRAPAREQTESMTAGIDLEPYICERFARQTGFKIRRHPGLIHHPVHDWLLGRVDRMIWDTFGKRGVLEAKNIGAYSMADWNFAEGSEQEGRVPDYYLVQLQHYLGLTGLDFGYFAVLAGGQKFGIFRIERDDELIRMMWEEAIRFYEEHLIADVPPEVTGRDKEILSKIAGLLGAEEIPLSPELDALLCVRKTTRDEVKILGERCDGIDARVMEFLRANGVNAARGREFRVTWRDISTDRFDLDRFRRDFPEMAIDYVKKSEYKRFDVYPVKGGKK